MFSYVTLEQRVPGDHRLGEIRRLTDIVLRSLSEEFDSLYSASGRPSIAPEHVLRALLLQVFYSVHSERQLVEQLDYNLLFRWFTIHIRQRQLQANPSSHPCSPSQRHSESQNHF